MNKTFKVARSLTRGTVVTSEAASSRQGKALKTVVAAVAAALVGGVAVAEETTTAPETPAFTQDQLWVKGDVLTDKKITVTQGYSDQIKTVLQGGSLTIDGATVTVDFNKNDVAKRGAFSATNTDITVKNGAGNFNWMQINGGKLTVGGTDNAANIGAYGTVAITGTEVNVGKNGLIWGGLAGEEKTYQDITFTNSTVTLNGVAGENDLTSFAPKSSSRAVIFGSFLKNTVTNPTELAKYKNEGNKVVFANTKVNVTGAGAINALETVVDAASTITVGEKGDLLLTSISGTGQYNKMAPSKFTLKGAVDNAGTVTSQVDDLVVEGTFKNTGKFVADTLTIGNGGVVETTSFADAKAEGNLNPSTSTFNAKTINLKDGGNLKLTVLNSNVAAGQGGQAVTSADKNDQFHINGKTLNLDGGVVTKADGSVLKNFKVGKGSQSAKGQVTPDSFMTIKSGEYGFDNLTIGTTGSVTLTDGSLTLAAVRTDGKFEQTGGDLTINGTVQLQEKSSLTITRGNLYLGENAKIEKIDQRADDPALNGGNVYATSTQAFAKAETGLNYAEKGDVLGSFAIKADSEALITVTDAQKLTTAQIESAVSTYSDALLTFGNLQVVDADGKEVTEIEFKDTYGFGMLDKTVTVKTNTADTTKAEATVANGKDVGFAALKVAPTVKSLSVTGEGSLTLAGNGGNLFVGSDILESATIDNLDLGMTAESKGTVNVKTLNVKTMSVIGAFDAQNIVVNAQGKVEVVEGGVLSADQISGGTVTIAKGGVLAFGERQTEKTEVSAAPAMLAAENAGDSVPSTPLQPATKYLNQVDTAVDASEFGSFVVTDAKNGVAKALNALDVLGVDYDEKKNAVLYVDKTLGLTDTGSITLGKLADPTNDPAQGTQVAVGEGGIIVVDAMSFLNTDSKVFEGMIRTAKGEIALAGLNAVGTIQLASKVGSQGFDNFIDGNILFDEKLVTSVTGTDGKVTPVYNVDVTFNKNAVDGYDELSEALESHLTTDSDAKLRNLLVALGNEKTGLLNEGKTSLSDEGELAAEEIFATPAVSGVYNVAYDAAEQVNATLARRNVEPTTGMGVWADVFYSANEAKKIYNGEQGYSTDIYGGMIGFDTVFSCGAKLGAALTIGTGDTDSEKSVSKFSTDSDFYGLSVYTGKNLGDTSIYLSADASYLWVDNDVSTKVAGYSESESIDSNVFTIGARADWRAYEGDVLQVTPHFGMRYTSIDADDYLGLESDSMNVFELPIGVKVAGNFETNGVKIAPAFDFTVVPQVGDTQVNTLLGDVDVIDDLYNAALGVEATTGNFTFGLSYKYGFGKDDRSNNSFNANVRYTF